MGALGVNTGFDNAPAGNSYTVQSKMNEAEENFDFNTDSLDDPF